MLSRRKHIFDGKPISIHEALDVLLIVHVNMDIENRLGWWSPEAVGKRVKINERVKRYKFPVIK